MEDYPKLMGYLPFYSRRRVAIKIAETIINS